MSIIKTNESLTIIKDNHKTELNISIIDSEDRGVAVYGEDVLFLYNILGEWISKHQEDKKIRSLYEHT